MKKRITKTVVFAMIMMCFQMPEIGHADKIDHSKMNMYAMETIIAQPEKIENEWVRLDGYAKFEENGVALYKTEKDYKYDTKENAVWLPEREEASIKEYFGDPEEQIDGSAWALSVVIQPVKKDSPYAAEAMYVIDESDKIWQNAKPRPEKRKKYNRENEKEEAKRISIYRLLGDPWSYDGKKVCVDVRNWQELEMVPNYEDRDSKMFLATNVFGEEMNWNAAWSDLIKEYKQREEFKDLSDKATQYYIECAAYNIQARFEMELMFYMMDISDWGTMVPKIQIEIEEETNVRLYYWPSKIRINEKDKEKWEEEIGNLYEKKVFHNEK